MSLRQKKANSDQNNQLSIPSFVHCIVAFTFFISCRLKLLICHNCLVFRSINMKHRLHIYIFIHSYTHTYMHTHTYTLKCSLKVSLLKQSSVETFFKYYKVKIHVRNYKRSGDLETKNYKKLVQSPITKIQNVLRSMSQVRKKYFLSSKMRRRTNKIITIFKINLKQLNTRASTVRGGQ